MVAGPPMKPLANGSATSPRLPCRTIEGVAITKGPAVAAAHFPMFDWLRLLLATEVVALHWAKVFHIEPLH